MGLYQTKKFVHNKKTNQQRDWEKNFADNKYDKDLVSRIYKKLKALTEKSNN